MKISPPRLRLSVIVVSSFLLVAARANPSPPPSTSEPTPPTTAAYTNQPNLSVPSAPLSNNSPDLYQWRDPTFGNQVFVSSSTYYSRPSVFYFPPTPPPLGGSILLFRLPVFGEPDTVLPQLRPFVGEPFYAPLSAHLHRETLSKSRLKRLDAYQAARTLELVSLRTTLTAARDAEAPARARLLADFAAQQTPRLAALEAEAEFFRDHLVSGGFLDYGADWNDNRTWALGDDLRYESRVDEFKVIRASAFFADGLSPAQRRLLREFAMELAEPVGEPTAAIALDAPKPLFYFAPETARIELPAGLPSAIKAKLDAYRDAKSALKAELRAAIYKQDRAYFGFTRTKALRALAAEQAPRLAELEVRAEELRVLLADFPRASRPPASLLPTALSQRIAAYLREKQDLQRTLVEKLAALKAEFPSHRVEFIRKGDGHDIDFVANRRTARAEEAKIAALKLQLIAFNTEQRRRFTTLGADKDKLQDELIEFAKSKLNASAGTVDTDVLLNAFARQFSRQETWQRFRDYDTAVLEPGLSPEQRRLLYADALVLLELPLPRGSDQP